MNDKGTSIGRKTLINAAGTLLDFSTPKVMGIINQTPDSFYAESRSTMAIESVRMAEAMLSDGATIIDIGAQSTRPGAPYLRAADEWYRLQPALVQLRKQFPNAILSVDTFHSMVANNALLEGANMINDVSAGSMDNGMWATIAKHRVPYLIMHMQGTPETMQQDPQYDHVVHTVMQFFNERIRALNALGVVDLIIDPGFGFGKTIAHNFSLLKNLSAFKMHHAILLTGLSRKSMIYQTLGTNADEALNATTALHMVALNNGAQILRTHDVKEAMETIAMYNALQAAE